MLQKMSKKSEALIGVGRLFSCFSILFSIYFLPSTFVCQIFFNTRQRPLRRYFIYRCKNTAESDSEGYSLFVFREEKKAKPLSKTGIYVHGFIFITKSYTSHMQIDIVAIELGYIHFVRN